MKRFALLLSMLLSASANAQMGGDIVSPGVASLANGNPSSLFDSRFFSAGTALEIYVSTTGNDTACNGTTSASAASGVLNCAYASVGKALRTIPSGFTASPTIHVAAGTYSATDQWVMPALPGRSPAPSGGVVRVLDDCSSPTATFTTTGAGTAVVSSAGGGQNGGVTKVAQFTFAPTVGTGSITGVTDGSHYLRNSPAAGSAPTVTLVRASTSPNLVLGVTSGTALTTRSLCPFSVIFSGAITLRGPVDAIHTFGTSASMIAYGLKFSSLNPSGFQCNGCNLTGPSSVLSGREVALNNTIVNGKFNPQAVMPGRLGLQGNLFLGGAYLQGQWQSVTGNIISNTSGQLLWVNAGDASGLSTITAQGGISSLVRNDFEGTGTGILAWSSLISQPVTGANSVDITGAYLDLHYGSSYIVAGAGAGVSGKVTIASTVKSASQVATNGAYSVTNVTVAGQDWLVGAQTVAATASLPVTDYGSNARVFASDNGPAAVPVLQGGTGSSTAPVLGTATTDLLTVNGRITQVAAAPSSYTAGTCTAETGTGDDEHGTITATCTAGQTAIITFSSTYGTAPHCWITPSNAAAAATTSGMAYGTAAATTLTITALTAATAGTWTFECRK